MLCAHRPSAPGSHLGHLGEASLAPQPPLLPGHLTPGPRCSLQQVHIAPPTSPDTPHTHWPFCAQTAHPFQPCTNPLPTAPSRTPAPRCPPTALHPPQTPLPRVQPAHGGGRGGQSGGAPPQAGTGSCPLPGWPRCAAAHPPPWPWRGGRPGGAGMCRGGNRRCHRAVRSRAGGPALSAVLLCRAAEAGPAGPCAQPPGPARPAQRRRGWAPAATGTEPMGNAASLLGTAVPGSGCPVFGPSGSCCCRSRLSGRH